MLYYISSFVLWVGGVLTVLLSGILVASFVSSAVLSNRMDREGDAGPNHDVYYIAGPYVIIFPLICAIGMLITGLMAKRSEKLVQERLRILDQPAEQASAPDASPGGSFQQ